MSKWQKVDDDVKETPLTEFGNLKTVRIQTNCCQAPDLWFQATEVSPVTDQFRVVCKSCGREGGMTDWSAAKAIAAWNIELWNSNYMGRDPLKLADKVEGLNLEQTSIADLITVVELLKKAPQYLRSLVYESETQRLDRFINDDVLDED